MCRVALGWLHHPPASPSALRRQQRSRGLSSRFASFRHSVSAACHSAARANAGAQSSAAPASASASTSQQSATVLASATAPRTAIHSHVQRRPAQRIISGACRRCASAASLSVCATIAKRDTQQFCYIARRKAKQPYRAQRGTAVSLKRAASIYTAQRRALSCRGSVSRSAVGISASSSVVTSASRRLNANCYRAVLKRARSISQSLRFDSSSSSCQYQCQQVSARALLEHTRCVRAPRAETQGSITASSSFDMHCTVLRSIASAGSASAT